MALWDDKKVPSPFSNVKPKYAMGNVRAPSSAMQTLRSVQNKPALSVGRPSDEEMRSIVARNTEAPKPRYANKMQFDQDNYVEPPEAPPPSILEILMGKLGQQYQGPDPSKMDFSALDKAMETRLGMLGNARGQIQGNFDKSDANIGAMHSQFENDVRTNDAARYNAISDQQKGNLTANMNQGVQGLEGARAKAVAERQEMLQRLGIQEAGGAVDPGAQALDRGIGVMQERNNANQNMADQQRGNNLSYNNTVAQSIGQAGVARRSALQQQLAGLMGKVDMAESEARAQNQIERQRSMSSAGDAGYKQWNDDQNRTMDLFQTLTNEGVQRDRMGMSQQKEVRPSGIGAVAYDLENSGIDPAAAQAGLAALSQILSEGNYLEGANGPDGNMPYDRANIMIQKLKAKGVDPMTATQVGTSYGNL